MQVSGKSHIQLQNKIMFLYQLYEIYSNYFHCQGQSYIVYKNEDFKLNERLLDQTSHNQKGVHQLGNIGSQQEIFVQNVQKVSLLRKNFFGKLIIHKTLRIYKFYCQVFRNKNSNLDGQDDLRPRTGQQEQADFKQQQIRGLANINGSMKQKFIQIIFNHLIIRHDKLKILRCQINQFCRRSQFQAVKSLNRKQTYFQIIYSIMQFEENFKQYNSINVQVDSQ
ncbi:hypothetical protein pb186bvf_010088 [Paramecium bursaria]